MDKPHLDAKVIITRIKGVYNDRETALYYLKKARDAGARAKVGVDAQNTSTVIFNLNEVINNIEMLYELLRDDTTDISEENG